MYRGDQFCITFASLRELRSIIPSNVNIVTLTAKAIVTSLFSFIAAVDVLVYIID